MYTTLPNAVHFNIITYILWIVCIIPIQFSYICDTECTFIWIYIFKCIVTNNFRNIIHNTIEIKKIKVKFYEKSLHFISCYKRLGQ